MQETRFLALLRTLHDSGAKFILVGGTAAILNGAPIHTYDIDIVYARDSENVNRLLKAIESLDAVFRMQPERRLRPTVTHLSASGHLNLITRSGPLDLLTFIGANLAYEDLIPHSAEMDIGEGMRLRVLDLETIIAVKEQLAGDKDVAVLPVLRETLKQTRDKG